MIQPKGEEEKVFLVRKGVDMVIPVMAVHRDPQFYPEPERFDPGRFSDENKSKVIPGTYLPFGWGPRNCIGKIYALFIETANFFILILPLLFIFFCLLFILVSPTE